MTLGSLGDLHPCLALGAELRDRGVDVSIITTEFYRGRVEGLQLHFIPMRPDWDPTAPELVAQCDDLKKGPEVLFRKVILPHLRHTYEDLLVAIKGVDLMISGELVYAAPLVAEKLGLRWASLILSPASFFSMYDPPLLVNAPWMLELRKAGLLPYKALFNLAGLGTRHWWSPVRELRASEGLRRSCDPLMRDKFSPHLVLAAFSSWLGLPQRDWPKQTVQTGFLFHREAGKDKAIGMELDSHISSNGPPMIFTLGSTAVAHPGTFYETSLEAARQMGTSAVLIGATSTIEHVGPKVLSVPYAPYSEIFPKASVIVHQGGSGTTAQALRAGRPMLFVPWGWDQPDNAMRVERRGSALSVRKDQYSVSTAISTLERLQREPAFTSHARAAANHVSQEPGLKGASDQILAMLG